MIAGHLQEKGGKYYAVLNCKHRDGKRFPKWIPTDLTVKKGNKRAAEKMLEDFRTSYNVFGELPSEEAEGFEENQTQHPQMFQKLRTICSLQIICSTGSRTKS